MSPRMMELAQIAGATVNFWEQRNRGRSADCGVEQNRIKTRSTVSSGSPGPGEPTLGRLTLSGAFITIRDSLRFDSTSGSSTPAVLVVLQFALGVALVEASAARHTDNSRRR